VTRLEEEIWEARNRRLAEALAVRKGPAEEPDPLRHQLREHLAGIAHVHEILLLVQDPKAPGGKP
jgi:hypothetical protein